MRSPVPLEGRSHPLRNLAGRVAFAAWVAFAAASSPAAADCSSLVATAQRVESEVQQALTAGDYGRVAALSRELEQAKADCKTDKRDGGEQAASEAGEETTKKGLLGAIIEETGGVDGLKAAEERRKRLEKEYGVAIGAGGAKAVKDRYRRAPKKIRDSVKEKDFTPKELMLIERALEKLDPVIHGSKDTLRKITRVNGSISSKRKGGKTVWTGPPKDTTMGEWFGEKGTLVLTDLAGSPDNFDNKDDQFQGTVIHEVAHGLLGSYDPRTGKKYRDSNKNPLVKEWKKVAGWKSSTTRDPKAKEKPPSDYAETSAGEDLAESVMLYLMDRKSFAKKSPKRAAFLDDVFEKAAKQKKKSKGTP
jgi:hypothetical protein